LQDSGGQVPHGLFSEAATGLFYGVAINDRNAIIDCMASITIRNLEEATKRKLRIRAAMHGRSMEQEAREILKNALRQKPRTGADLVKAIRQRFAPLGGVELEPFPREPIRDPDWLKD
jgi:plasmid stability protein